MADELHYRRLLRDIAQLVGKAEAERRTQGLSIDELADLKQRLLRDLMRPSRRSA